MSNQNPKYNLEVAILFTDRTWDTTFVEAELDKDGFWYSAFKNKDLYLGHVAEQKVMDALHADPPMKDVAHVSAIYIHEVEDET